mmetsp:Transcript_77816/g.166833  ORF Transcript_77816/g.166833 Transcript_77816/m.166833 type:complete len:308 (-) Transcript_77816:1550-2473(-)
MDAGVRPSDDRGIPRERRILDRLQDNIRLPDVVPDLPCRSLVLRQLRGAVESQEVVISALEVLIQEITPERPRLVSPELLRRLRALALLRLATAVGKVHMDDALHNGRIAIVVRATLQVTLLANWGCHQWWLAATQGAWGTVFAPRRLHLASHARALRAEQQALALRLLGTREGFLDPCRKAADVGARHVLPLTSARRCNALLEALVKPLRWPQRRNKLLRCHEDAPNIFALAHQELLKQHRPVFVGNESHHLIGENLVHVAEPTVKAHKALFDVQLPKHHSGHVLAVGEHGHRRHGVGLVGMSEVV